MNDQLSLQRLLWLLRADVLRNHRAWLVASGTGALVALGVSLIGAYDRVVGDGFYTVVFGTALFALGTVATSHAFADLHGRTTNTALLLLPASALEKTLSRLLLMTVGTIVYLLLFTTVLSWLLEGVNALLFGVRRPMFTPVDSAVWMIVPQYLVVQSLFFLGAAWFRKLHYIKTVGAVLLIWFCLVGVAVAIALVFRSVMWDDGIRVNNFDAPFEWLTNVVLVAYYLALPVFCWFVAWLRVTETQVSHGI